MQAVGLRETIVLQNHPSEQDLALFLHGSPPPGGSTQVVRHLLAGCGECRRRLAAIGWSRDRLERLVRLPRAQESENEDRQPRAGGLDYDRAFVRAETTLSAFLDRGRPVEQPPQALLAELFPLPSDERAEPTDQQRAIPQLVRWLIERSHAVRYRDTEEMLHLARLARLAVEVCSVKAAGSPQKLADLRIQAWGHFANTLRVCGRLEEAEQAFAIAETCLPDGTGDPMIEALLLEQLGSHSTSRRCFTRAVELLERAENLYQEVGVRWRRARARILKAIAMVYSGEPEEASRLLRQAIPMIEPDEDPYLLLAARHNLVYCLIDLDRTEEALAVYHEIRELNRQFTDPLIQLRNTWQEGKLLRELGHLFPAEEKLLQARRGFMARGLAYEVAVVSLDLADVYAKMGCAAEVNQLVSETLPIFRALRIGRDMLAALIQLRQVARQQRRAADQAS